MEPIPVMLLLIGGGIVLLAGELLLPTHGVLGIAGLACFAGAVGVCFYINRWLGLGVLVASIIASPFIWNFTLALWLRSPMGKRMVPPLIESRVAPLPVSMGDEGVAVSELRPMGEVEFATKRIEAISERGMIRAGQKVRVVSVSGGGLPTVRAIAAEPTSA